MENGTETRLERRPQIVRVDAAGLQQHWAFVREKLLLIQAKSFRAHQRAGFKHPYIQWIPEQIRMAIFNGFIGRSTVELYFVLGESQSIDGLFITSCPIDEWKQVPLVLFLWLVWAGRPKIIEQAEAFVYQLGRDRGCVCVKHASARLGYLRRQRHLGEPGRRWRVSEYTWCLELTDP